MLDPTNPDYWLNMGVNKMLLGEPAVARDYWFKALAIDPDDELARKYLDDMEK